MDFKGKKILITGASSGIGEAIAVHFAAKGAYLLIAGRNLKELERVKSNCQKAEGVEIILLDLENHDDLFDKAASIIHSHKKIDVLINNAGVSQRALAKDLPFEFDKKIVNIDLLGTIALTKAFLPSMLENKSGSIVTITSMVGKYGTPMRSAYAAAKHGLHGFFDALRAEVFDDNIQVLLVCPGFIKTNVSINAIGPGGGKQGTMDQATGNGIEPKAVAVAIESALNSNSEEINVAGAKELLGLYMKRFAPNIFSKMIRKMKVT
ncbi:MAG: SDR family NAD(P)-dependent oxidoreductase [Chitinophagales bacterium]|nr:SDR family NAD(P)-dependent oxidoreductase [Chitinophagales bacterium]